MTLQIQARTRMFARVVGPFLAVLTGVAVGRAPQLWAHTSEFVDNPLWAWVAGAFILLAGLIVIALHPYWRGFAAASVSALGWLTAIKGLSLLAFPETIMSIPESMLGAAGWWRALYLVFVAWGLYLTYVGWAPQRPRPALGSAESTPDLPRSG